MSYGRGYVFRRVCVRCRRHRPMAGGATLRNYRWICAACRAKAAAESRRFYGPSLAKESRQFRAEFGDDETLLATVDRLLEKVT